VRHVNTFGAFMGYGVGGLVVAGGLLIWWFRRGGYV